MLGHKSTLIRCYSYYKGVVDVHILETLALIGVRRERVQRICVSALRKVRSLG